MRSERGDESWKDKPFSKEDSRFFFKGIDELSNFSLKKLRGILAYLIILNFAPLTYSIFSRFKPRKFVSLYQMHAKAFEAVLEHGKREGEIRIAYLGAGPGTASIQPSCNFCKWLPFLATSFLKSNCSGSIPFCRSCKTEKI